MNLEMDTFTLVLLVAAAVVFWLLRSVLGRRTGFEKPAPDFTRPAEVPTRKTAALETESVPATAPVDEPVWKGHGSHVTSLPVLPMPSISAAIEAKAYSSNSWA
jgi:hypothetical protein